MIRSRLREIRKQKGLTLQQVAERIRPEPTTAQTIGRLETGMRTLSVEWVERIAEALGCEAAELLALPEEGDLPVTGAAGADGAVAKKTAGTLALRLAARDAVVVRIAANLGPYAPGDLVVCDRGIAATRERWEGRDCLVEDVGGRRFFAKPIAGEREGRVRLVPIANDKAVLRDVEVAWIAPAVSLVRDLASG